MFEFLKRILLYVILTVTRHSKRAELVKRLTAKTRKRNYINDIEYIPAVLDDIIDLPNDCRDTISFTGFDKDGVCARIVIERQSKGRTKATLDLDFPGIGCFKYVQTADRQTARGSDDDDDVCDGLKLNVICQKGMQRWKIFLRTPLEHINSNGQRLHATIFLYWACLFDPFDHFASPPCWTRAGYLTWLSWYYILSNSWQEDTLRYEQFGELRGRVAIENYEEQSVRLKCVRERCFTFGDKVSFEKVCSEHIAVDESGLTVSNTFIKLPNNATKPFACVSYPVGDTVPVKTSIKEVKGLDQIKSLLFSPHLFCDRETFNVINKFQRSCFNDKTSSYKFITGLVNNKKSFGFYQSFNTSNKCDANATETETISHGRFNTTETIYCDQHIKVVSLGDDVCSGSLNLVGGKARNLSLLSHNASYNVLKGICVTTNAYREHISKDSELKEAIGNISKCLRNCLITEIQQACHEAEEMFRRSSILEDLQMEIQQMLIHMFGENKLADLRFAVRSSGECEDGEQLSSAGQMETILSVKGFDNIVDAIKSCWASAVSYRVVEYRRQNGQCLVEDLGVIVQEMIDAEKAGVLFTNNPVTGNESVMVINASYGLGEAVVSGKVNADTVTVKRDHNDKVTIKKQDVGDKRIRIVAGSSESGVKTETVPEGERDEICLTKDEIETICDIGISIEKEVGSAQDIEWAISKGKLVILQTRPITTLDMETDADIMHEFDMPVVNENLLFTTANVQEALPGALTPLTGDIMLSAGCTAVKRTNDARLPFRSPVHPVRHISPFAGVPLLSMTCVMMGVTLMAGENTKSDIELNVIGEVVDEHKLETIKDFYGRPYPNSLGRISIFLKSLIAGKNESALFDKCKAKTDAMKVAEDASTAKELYKAIDANLSFINSMLHVYFYKSSTSSIWAHAIMDILKGSSPEANSSTSVMVDIALILSECKDVYSADVPNALNSLAELIAESDLKEHFLELPDQDCDEYLKLSGNTEIQSQYTQLLSNHGHRCMREGEFYMKSWKQDPVPLIKTVKQIIKRDGFEGKKESKSIGEIVKSLKIPLSYIKRILLSKFLIRKARAGVRQREIGKTTLIKTSDIFKQAYWKLASMMVKEGRLPDDRLLFFLTHHEIDRLLESKSVKLIRLAKRRFKLWPEMDRIKYPKLSFGLPKPIQEINVDTLETEFTLRGMPVCLGKFDGTARVVKLVEKADEIKEGEILICVFTDVGWSPYFCLIKGLVTELGGLISHGAVVARECGIPCIVNVANATDLIKTGDHVVIDGSQGTITKLEF